MINQLIAFCSETATEPSNIRITGSGVANEIERAKRAKGAGGKGQLQQVATIVDRHTVVKWMRSARLSDPTGFINPFVNYLTKNYALKKVPKWYLWEYYPMRCKIHNVKLCQILLKAMVGC